MKKQSDKNFAASRSKLDILSFSLILIQIEAASFLPYGLPTPSSETNYSFYSFVYSGVLTNVIEKLFLSKHVFPIRI